MSNLDKVFQRNRVTKLGIDAMITNYLRLEKELYAAQRELVSLKTGIPKTGIPVDDCNQGLGLIESKTHTHKTYDMARFYISDGMYSIEEIEKMLVHMKAGKKRQDKYLKQSIQPLKEKNT